MSKTNTKVRSDYHIVLADAKEHLNIETSYTDDDDYITQLIKDAEEETESYIDGDIATTANTTIVYDFVGTFLRVTQAPFISLTSVKYLDSDDVQQTVTLADIIVRVGVQSFDITLPSSIDTKQLEVKFASGYGSGLMPNDLRRAILLKIGDYYDVQRGSMVFTTNKDSGAFERVLAPYRRITY